MKTLNQRLAALRVDDEIYRKIMLDAENNGCSESIIRRMIYINHYNLNTIKVDALKFNLDLSKTERYTLRLPKSLIDEINNSSYATVYGTLNSLIQALLTSSLYNIEEITDADKKNNLLLHRELQSIGRNLNQITKALNYQLKTNNKIEIPAVERAYIIVCELREEVKILADKIDHILKIKG